MEKKTECEIVQDLLLGYVDGVLNLESKKLVEKHLLECNNCQKKLEEIKLDIKENNNNQKKEIDYLKKIRRKSKIKSIIMSIGFIFIICLIIYLNKFIKVNNFMNKAEKSLKSNNFYKETTQILYNNQVSVRKVYFKDGKYKEVDEIYSDNGVEVNTTKYATVDTDEIIVIDESQKKATIEKSEVLKMFNKEGNLKHVPFVISRNGLFERLGTAFIMSIATDTYDIGKEYYVLRNQFEQNQNWEIWIDKETGLPLKEINRDGEKIFFPDTNVVKEIRDMTQEYKYEFDVVTDDDVKVPDLTNYEVVFKNVFEELNK